MFLFHFIKWKAPNVYIRTSLVYPVESRLKACIANGLRLSNICKKPSEAGRISRSKAKKHNITFPSKIFVM
jgi:hypothetical protein